MNELPPKARAFLEAAGRGDEPSASERARSERVLRSALAAHGVTGLPPLAPREAAPNASTPGAKLARVGISVPLKVGLAVIALAGAAYLGRVTLSRSTTGPQPSAAGATRSSSLRSDTAARPQPRAARSSSPRSDTATNPPPSATSRAALANRDEHRAPPAAALPLVVRSAPARNAAPQRGSHRPSDDLAAQLKTLETANNLVREGDFTAALHLLDRSETASAAVLREERRGLRVLARCGVAPDALAQRERDAFLRQYPRSVLAERVRGTCTAKPREAR